MMVAERGSNHTHTDSIHIPPPLMSLIAKCRYRVTRGEREEEDDLRRKMVETEKKL